MEGVAALVDELVAELALPGLALAIVERGGEPYLLFRGQACAYRDYAGNNIPI